ncbi:uncharacterized protein LOC132932569 [Metopolophium dirhodum]|uniref:uncharacterized protein LOC132932569 n=1 Tax=Metopolophium dirhodum TaxID=44670 RepID=UPI00298FFA00|nr:uncharacterized protein LOC132932569 [Metopolophium dirhodum]
MASKLSTLAKNLVTPDFSKFRETGKHFATSDMNLVTCKGVYPYEYTDEWSKLDENALPDKAEFYTEFYSILTESAIKDEEYEHAMKVWKHFGCKAIGEYSDLYLKINVLLLADIFENVRDVCMKTYNLDPAYYYTTPGFKFDGMLKFTAIKLELLSDYEMLLMFEDGIRGGLTQTCGMQNQTMKKHQITTRQIQNHGLHQSLRLGNVSVYALRRFQDKWVKPSLDGLYDLTEDSPIGRVYEVHFVYPKKLHDKHNDLQILPQNSIPPSSKVRKLMATFELKKNYVVHYRNLQQAINNGLVVEKVHRVIQFKQSPWLAQYIELNTNMREKAENEFERDFFKLMNNAVFGFSVLDISKTLMYNCHYNVMKRHYGDDIKLMYTDTDSLVYHIITDDFYQDLANNANLLDKMDTSDLPKDHSCYIPYRKKIPGLFSDETKGDIMTEFCALRAVIFIHFGWEGNNQSEGD